MEAGGGYGNSGSAKAQGGVGAWEVFSGEFYRGAPGRGRTGRVFGRVPSVGELDATGEERRGVTASYTNVGE